MRTSTEFRSQISASTISTSIDFRDLIKGRLMCIVFCSNIVQITMCFFVPCPFAIDASSCMKLMHTRTDFKLHSTIETTLRNKCYCKSWNAQKDKSLRKICHYRQNVPQYYYLLDALVYNKFSQRKNMAQLHIINTSTSNELTHLCEIGRFEFASRS